MIVSRIGGRWWSRMRMLNVRSGRGGDDDQTKAVVDVGIVTIVQD